MEENIRLVDGKESLSQAFLDYSAYNLQRRAIPDSRDGLKWSARQLLHAQSLAKLTCDKPFKKALKSVGQATSFSYTHGDSSCYGTYIRMAKPFAYRYPLQEANGNYGTLIDPQDHSASRYVEIRGSHLAKLLLDDLDKNTINEWEDTYDLEGQFPRVLPSKGFYNIVNGCQSIGSGTVSSIPQFNLKEVNEALSKLIKNPDINFEEILCYPDFATGGILVNQEEVKESLLKGSGKACKLRATIEYNNEDNSLIVTEMPYSVYTNTVCQELATILENNPKCGIKSFIDLTGTKPYLVIYLTKTANPINVIKFLYKNTSLQSHFTIKMTMLDKGIIPREFGWREMLLTHINHEKEVYRNSFIFDLTKIKNRLHIIEGLLKAIDKIDEVIKLIKESADTKNASIALQRFLEITEIQAKAILDIKLSRLAHLEVAKLEKEKDDLEIEKNRIENILLHEELLNQELISGWNAVSKKYGDQRRTKILNIEKDDEEEPVEKKQLIVYLTNLNNIYAYEDSTLISQRRGGVGTKLKLLDNEFIKQTVTETNYNNLLAFTSKGKVFNLILDKIELNTKVPLSTILELEDGEIVSILVSDEGKESSEYILFVTKNGVVKKTKLSEYKIKKNNGVSAIKLKDKDEIREVFLINNIDLIGIGTKNGYFTYFDTSEIGATGRMTMGVKGINLKTDDEVCSAIIINNSVKEIVSLTKTGYIKKTPMSEFSKGSRANKGVIVHKLEENDSVVSIKPITSENKEIIVYSSSSIIKFNLSEVPQSSRNTIGNHSIKLKKSQSISGMVII